MHINYHRINYRRERKKPENLPSPISSLRFRNENSPPENFHSCRLYRLADLSRLRSATGPSIRTDPRPSPPPRDSSLQEIGGWWRRLVGDDPRSRQNPLILKSVTQSKSSGEEEDGKVEEEEKKELVWSSPARLIKGKARCRGKDSSSSSTWTTPCASKVYEVD